MAIYTHNEILLSPATPWYLLSINGDDPTTATTTLLVLPNSDGTFTRIHGSDFTYDEETGEPTGGTVTSIDRSDDASGTTIYETVTGLSLSLVDLTSTDGEGNREAFALIFAGVDTFTGYSGNDYFVGGPQGDVFTGGTGADTVSYDNALAAVTVNLGANTASGSDAAGDTFNSIENLVGSDFGDSFTGNGANNVLTGGLGNDLLNGGNGATTGNDVLDGGEGNLDTANYANNANITVGITVTLSATSQVVGKGDNAAVVGTDTLINVEAVRGSNANDTFTADATFNASSGLFNDIQGMGGDDSITGNGSTRLSYTLAASGVAVDLFAGTAQSIAAGDAAGIGVDTFTGVNAVRGSDFDDTITAAGVTSDNNLLFSGLRGNDILTGSSANSDIARYDQVSTAAGTINNGIIAVLDATSTVTDQAGGNAAGTDTLIGIEQVRGTNQVDSFTATTSFVAGNGTGFNAFEGMGGNDTIVGNGFTRVGYSQASAGVTVDLFAGTAQSTSGGDAAGIGVDSFAGTIGPNNINRVNGVRGSNFDDILTASGGRGEFDFIGGGGNDTLIGSQEAIDNFDSNEARYDTNATTNGVAVVLGTTSTATDIGGTSIGTDTLIAIERVRGTDFNDTFTATIDYNGAFGVENRFEGMDGDDTITGNGSTVIAYTQALAAVTVDFRTGTAQSTAADDAAGVGLDTFTGVNSVVGSRFDDILIGSDSLLAESFGGSSGNDIIDGGGGDQDRVNYVNNPGGIIANLTTGVVIDGYGDTDTVSNIEGVNGSEFADEITGDGNANRLQGNHGDDELYGLGGDDALVGDDVGPDGGGLYGGAFGVSTAFDFGNDLLDGGTGADLMWGGKGNDTYVVDNVGDVVTELVSEGTDTVQTSLATYTLGANVENLTGTVGTGQTLIGNELANTITGGGGNDTLRGGAGADALIGGSGEDTASYSNALEFVTANLGNAASNTGDAAGDSYTGIENLQGSDFNDILTGDSSNNLISGRNGNDTLSGGNGPTTGNDTLNGGSGNDIANYSSNTNITSGITVTLSTSSTVVGDAVIGTDTLISVERIRGTNFADGFTVTTSFSGNNGNFAEFEGNGGNDTYVGIGNTRIGFSQALAGVTVNLLAGTAQSTEPGDAAGIGVDSFAGTVGPDNINAISSVRGSNFDDTIDASGARGRIEFIGLAGNDTFIGSMEAINNFDDNEARYDIATMNGVEIVLDTTSTVKDLAGGSSVGTDTLINVERVRGTNFADTFTATVDFSGAYGATNHFEGMGGNDTITGNGVTFIQYGNALAAVTVNFALGTAQSSDLMDGAGIGIDSFTGVNQVSASNFNDTLIGSDGAQAESFNGGGGDDTIDGGGGTLDRVSYRPAPSGINANLTTGVVLDGSGGTDSITNIEGVSGSEFGDIITGNELVNRLQGQHGDDQLFGMAGNDLLVGDDTGPLEGLWGGAFGGGGAAFDSGNDLLDGGTGADQMWGGKGNDTYVVDDAGDEVIELDSEGTDTVETSLASYALEANVENLTGTVATGQTLIGNGLANTITGGDGDDTLRGGAGGDVLAGGLGSDTLDYSTSGEALQATLAGNGVIGGDATGDTFSGIENVTGTAFGDLIVGDSNNNVLTGLAGGDTLVGLDGNDTLNGGSGVDFLSGGIGNDTLNGGDDGDALHGEEGDDTINGDAGDDVLVGYAGADTLNGGTGADTVIGNEGNDILSGGDGVDQLFGYEDDDQLDGGLGGDFLSGGTGNDTLNGGDGDDALHGEEGNDTLNGDVGNDVLVGYDGDDTLNGGDGHDTVIGNAGDDTLNGNDGNDQMFGYEGVDTMDGGAGADFLAGGTGNDVLNGGDDGDVLDGEADDDQLFGGAGGDNLNGNDGDDEVNGGSGNDGLLGANGNDTLNGGADNDFLIGGDGNDTFVFENGTGNDLIVDFVAGAGVVDIIDIRDFGFADFNAVLNAANDVSGGVIITLDADDAIFVQGVAKSQFVADDFLI